MHVKAAVCFSTAGEGAGLYIDSGWESSVEEQTCRQLIMMSLKVNVNTSPDRGGAVCQFGESM